MPKRPLTDLVKRKVVQVRAASQACFAGVRHVKGKFTASLRRTDSQVDSDVAFQFLNDVVQKYSLVRRSFQLLVEVHVQALQLDAVALVRAQLLLL